MSERHRIDAWLKLVCLYKHRNQATEACRGGHVKINGVRVKPAAVVRQGDVIEFLAADVSRRVVVQGLPETQTSKCDCAVCEVCSFPASVRSALIRSLAQCNRSKRTC